MDIQLIHTGGEREAVCVCVCVCVLGRGGYSALADVLLIKAFHLTT